MRGRLMKKSSGINLRPGSRIVGKWQKNVYTIIRKLGSGMVGSVYLCKRHGTYAALKISRQSLSMTKEVNVLRAINKAQDIYLGPYLFDVDDWIKNENESYSFYVMEYIKGERFTTFMRKQNPEWIGVAVIQLLNQLCNLHKLGWVFGDLKADNLIVEQKSKKVRFIDVGGTTKVGRSVKEYTEFYDRGYWGLGSRKAEPSYDLFALVMVFLTIYYPTHFKKRLHSLEQIDEKVDKINDLLIIQLPFKKAIRGEYKRAKEMKEAIIHSYMTFNEKSESKKKKRWLEPILILIIANAFYMSTLFIF